MAKNWHGLGLTLLRNRIWAMFGPSYIPLGPLPVAPGGPQRAYVTQ